MDNYARYGVLVGIFLALLSIYPQASLVYQRGGDYNGATFFFDYDEPAYAAYLQALIDGRTRKNSIYAGSAEEPPAETFLTIQAFPAYAAAIPARLFGTSAEKSFIFLAILAAFTASICLFWLLSNITGNSSYAAVGTLFVLAFGALLAGNGTIKDYLELGPATISLPFLRRYTPAVPFPFFFLLCGSVWLAFRSDDASGRFLYAILTSICFGVLGYSYFYLWTAALAWMLILAILSFVLIKEDRRNLASQFWLPFFALSFLIGVPYFALLAGRSDSTDAYQALEQTRQLVWARPSIWAGTSIILAIVWFVRSKRLDLKSRPNLFAISFALLPIVVFNQQIITGYALQPFHYGLYVANYSVLLALVMLIGELARNKLLTIRPIVWAVVAVLLGGVVETHHAMRYRLGYNIRRDEAIQVNRRLADIGNQDSDTASQVTLNLDPVQADNQPVTAPYGVLWSEHLRYSSSLSHSEIRRRYFLYLYFTDRDPNSLRASLRKCPDGADCRGVFGWRVNPTLSINSHAPSAEEIRETLAEFEAFLSNLSAADAYRPTISFMVVPGDQKREFTNLEKWYELGIGETYGGYFLYPLTSKNPK